MRFRCVVIEWIRAGKYHLMASVLLRGKPGDDPVKWMLDLAGYTALKLVHSAQCDTFLVIEPTA